MRTKRFLGLMASVLPIAGCLGEASLVGPEFPENGGEPALATGGIEIRIVAPANGSTMRLGRRFAVRALQELRGQPERGRAQVQYSMDSTHWLELGPRFPWTSQQREVQSPSVSLDRSGLVAIRLAIHADGRESPALVSHPITIRCFAGVSAEVVSR